MKTKRLPRSFYLRPTLSVAKDLIGKYLIRKTRGHTLIGKIVEVEAYLGDKDPASHAYRGRTRRNDVMFSAGGHLYVYFTYGMHFCANVVTEKEGTGHAVLIRAVEPIDGIEVMKQDRSFYSGKLKEYDLTNGPAKLCQAFAIDRKDNGMDLLGDTIFITEGEKISRSSLRSSSRIGISKAIHHRWRFFLRNNPWVSMS